MVILFNIHSVRTEIQTSLDQFGFWCGFCLVVSSCSFVVGFVGGGGGLFVWLVGFVCVCVFCLFVCLFVYVTDACGMLHQVTQPENASRRVVTSIVMQREPFF